MARSHLLEGTRTIMEEMVLEVHVESRTKLEHVER